MIELFLYDDEILFQRQPNCSCSGNHNSPTTYISFNLGKIS